MPVSVPAGMCDSTDARTNPNPTNPHDLSDPPYIFGLFIRLLFGCGGAVLHCIY